MYVSLQNVYICRIREFASNSLLSPVLLYGHLLRGHAPTWKYIRDKTHNGMTKTETGGTQAHPPPVLPCAYVVHPEKKKQAKTHSKLDYASEYRQK